VIEPNFSESQLQQLINTEVTLRLVQSGRGMFLPVVISLPEEAVKGWDTGFFFPWLTAPGLDDHRGCNFFLQYKLASLLEGRRGGEWSFWRKPYFRFRIPHNSKDRNSGEYFEDYHQLEALRVIAAKGYPVYYVSNRTPYEETLFEIAKSQQLLDTQAIIKLRSTTLNHRYVTYTEFGKQCYMHSRPEEQPLSNWEDVLSASLESGTSTLSQLVPELEDTIRSTEDRRDTPGQLRLDAVYRRMEREDRSLSWTARATLVSVRLRQELNIWWFRHREALG
jgi:hypothetical protein